MGVEQNSGRNRRRSILLRFLHLSCGGSGELTMNTSSRITIDELKRRMESGEDFTIIDVRKPEAWADSDTMIPESIRVPLDDL